MAFSLSQELRQTQCWQVIKTQLESDLRSLREQNDGNHDAIKTASIRGEIARIKEMLAVERASPDFKPMTGHVV